MKFTLGQLMVAITTFLYCPGLHVLHNNCMQNVYTVSNTVTYPVLFMFEIFPEREICEAQSWLRLPPKRNEDNELLRLEVRELLFKGVIIGTSISALTG